MPSVSPGQVLPAAQLPSLQQVLVLDAIVSKVQVMLDEVFTKSMVSHGLCVRVVFPSLSIPMLGFFFHCRLILTPRKPWRLQESCSLLFFC